MCHLTVHITNGFQNNLIVSPKQLSEYSLPSVVRRNKTFCALKLRAKQIGDIALTRKYIYNFDNYTFKF